MLIHTRRQDEGIFWCILDEGNSNKGFGYSSTMEMALSDAKVELRRLMPKIEVNNDSCVKPDCPLVGQDGNIYNLVGIAAGTLRSNGLDDKVSEMTNRVFSSKSYYEALSIIGEYVNITSMDDSYEE